MLRYTNELVTTDDIALNLEVELCSYEVESFQKSISYILSDAVPHFNWWI